MNRSYSKTRHIQESNIVIEQRRFNQLIESKMGDVRPLISEQLLKKLFGLSDNAISNLGKSSGSLEVALSKSSNLITKAEGQFLKSASGSEIPISTIQTLVKKLESGEVNFQDVQIYLPKQLADGTEFRNVIQNIKPTSKVATGVSLGTIKSGTQISSKFFDPNKINFNNMTYIKDIESLNKAISNAISTGNYSAISKGGFEQYGIDNFREFLKNNVDLGKQMYADPKTGTWYFAVK
jgi:hypothetical protein